MDQVWREFIAPCLPVGHEPRDLELGPENSASMGFPSQPIVVLHSTAKKRRPTESEVNKRCAVKYQRNMMLTKCRTQKAKKASLDGFRRLIHVSGHDWGKVVTAMVHLQSMNDKWEELLEL